MMDADEARRRGLGAARGILIALAVSCPIWGILLWWIFGR